MPSVNKIASYHSMPSTRTKGQAWYPTSSRHRTQPSQTAALPPRAKMSMSTSTVPTLPGLHHPSGQQWNFFHELLSQDDEDFSEDFSLKPRSSAQNQSSGEAALLPEDRDSRSTAERGGFGKAVARSSRSLDTTSTVYDGRENSENYGQISPRMRPSADGDANGCKDRESAKTREFPTTLENQAHVRPLKDADDSKQKGQISRPSVAANVFSIVHPGSITERPQEIQRLAEVSPPPLSHRQDSIRQVILDGSLRFRRDVANGELITHDAVNQWTTCRALDDSGDDEDEEEDDNDDEDALRHSEAPSEEALRSVESCSPPADAKVFSRTASCASNLAGRRKRPLLLPPIMLPPIYRVKPTPLILRDEVYYATVGERARRPLTDDEWDKLKDCRYLRIRTLKRHLKV